MFVLLPAKTFRKNLRKILKSGRSKKAKIEKVINTLKEGELLSPEYSDHKLHGSQSHLRECHIENDLLLVYEIKEKTLFLHNIGSHSEIFG